MTSSGKMKKPWHENEEFWNNFTLDEKSLEMASEDVELLIELAELKPSMKVLDLCCGVGRHSVELAKRKFEVTGVDTNKNYLNIANSRAKEENMKIEFVKEDMRDFKRKEKFDAVINLFTSFGYFEDEEENINVLQNVFESLKPGGKFILDVMGKEIIAHIFKEKDWIEKNGSYRLFQRSVELDWSWLNNRWIDIVDGEVNEFEFSHWLYSAKELKDMLKGVGFTSVAIYGNFQGIAYNESANRLVAIGVK